MHRLVVTIGVTGHCVVTQAPLQPVRLICKSIDRGERFRSRWVAAGLIAGLMALAIGSSAAVAKPRNCQGSLDTCTDACYAEDASNRSGCTRTCVSSYVQCQDKEASEKGGPGSGGSKTKGGPRGSKHVGPVNASVPNTNPGVLNPNVGGTSGAANRPPVAQPATGGGLGNATTIPGATAGSSTGAILNSTGPLTSPPASTNGIFTTTRTGQGIGPGTGGTFGRQPR
jgi:hypothetical protein